VVIDLGESAEEVGDRGLPVGVVPPGPQRSPFAEAGVDDDPVDRAEVRPEGAEDLEDLLVVGDVERTHLHPAVGMGRGDLGLQRLEPVGTAGAQRQVLPQRRELPRHLGTAPAAGPGDQDRRAEHAVS